ncbi:MAG: DUF1223 domain-containing protein [Bryobacteraceae bacterium]
MRFSLLLLPVLAAAAFAATPGTTTMPVVVELFTSEGCSSCPPADKLLAELQKQYGANLIVLSEHVDYWDYIGWRDPFSTAEFTGRQRAYARTLAGENGVYTPQMVIDGRTGFVGSDSRKAQSEIKHASSNAKIAVHIEKRGDTFAISTAELPANANVLVAITEANLESDVRRGENSGHKLRHTGVVRSMHSLGKAERGKAFTSEVTPKVEGPWKRADLQLVVLVEDRSNHQILGAAASGL